MCTKHSQTVWRSSRKRLNLNTNLDSSSASSSGCFNKETREEKHDKNQDKNSDSARQVGGLTTRGRALFSSLPPHSSAFVDGVVRGLGSGLQGFAGSFLRLVRRPLIFTLVVHDGLPVFVQVRLLAARQLQEGGQAVQVGHFVEGTQQEVHHHQTHEQVDCVERAERQGSEEVSILLQRSH